MLITNEYPDLGALADQRWLESLPALESVKAGYSQPAEQVHEWLKSWGTEDES